SPGHRLGGTGRTLVVLLSGRRLRRILISILRRQVVFVRFFVGVWRRRWRLRLRLFLRRRDDRRATGAGRNFRAAHLLLRQVVLAERGVFLETDLEFVFPRHALFPLQDRC